MHKHRRSSKSPLVYEVGEIEKNVPLPNGYKPAQRGDIPFLKMKKGDSILFVGNKDEAIRIQSTVSAKASNFKRANPDKNMNFSTHIESDSSVRLWRIQ